MYRYLIELSKYILPAFMALYSLECFLVFRHRREEDRKGNYVRQYIYLFFIQFLSFLVIALQTGQIEYLFFYAFLQVALFSTIVLYQMIYPDINRLVINNMCMLLGIGFSMLSRLDFDKAIKQFFIVVLSLVAALIIPFFVHRLKFLPHLKWIYGILGLTAISLVLILGQVTHGSRISYTIAGITLQPSEFVKIIFVFFVASMLYEATNLKQIFISALWAGAHVLVLVLSRDLGSALIFFVGYLFMVLIATGNYLYLLAGLCAGSLASVAGYYLFSHVQVRVKAFLNPFAYIDAEGYQITQSLFAVGSGSWFGMGLYQGTPADIPYVESDFMFSAIAEEFGVIFALCMILVCLSCFLMFMNISMRLHNRFYQLIAAGFGVMYIFQVFLTIGGGIKFIPLTGVTLPLVSYGGSSVLTTLVIFSVIQGLYMIRVDEQKEWEEQRERFYEARRNKKRKEEAWARQGWENRRVEE
ncbi:MAG: FtsW/RodA/SpoVE family cell cycle protein [Lachnospiraceae bacterium]|nr:FtsW/RodA/SpoVE family cell cycle protein [Lachnospiraceae bacterium]